MITLSIDRKLYIVITAYRPDDIRPFYPATLDIETASDGSVLAIGFSYESEDNVRIYEQFTTWSGFIEFIRGLISKYKGNRKQLHKITRIWAHNGANFDWLSFVSYIQSTDTVKELSYILSGSKGIGCVIKLKSKETLRLYDSARMLPGTLDDLTKAFKTTTQKNDIQKYYKSRMEKFLAKYPDKFYKYLKNDVIALQELLFTFWTMIYELEGSIGYLPMTLPSLALKIWRKMLPDDFVMTVPWNDAVKAFSRRAYTGGRVEVAQSGKHEQVYVFDKNSMYPAVMRDNVFPSSARCGWTYTYRTDLLGLWEIEYEQTNLSIPPILRDEDSNEFTYQGKGVYTTSEIDLLKETGAKVTVKRGLCFQRSSKLFTDFVDKYYELKRQATTNGNEALAFVAKILMNSLYGKFGQRGVKQQIEQTDGKRIREIVANGGVVRVLSEEYMIVEENDVCEHEFVAIAAYVTSYARITLYRAILEAGTSYVYSDTDSVHTTSCNVLCGDKLGEMKLEAFGEGIYLGKKLYTIKTPTKVKIKAKGVGRAIKSGKLTYHTFTRLMNKERSVSMSFDTFPTVREVLSGSRPSCAILERVRTIRRLQ